MRSQRIEELVELLPLEAPYLMRIPREAALRGFPVECDLYAYAESDPAFGIGFIRSFVEMGWPLPVEVYESQLLRPYFYLQHGTEDEDVRVVFELRHEPESTRTILLECMLVRPDCAEKAIAEKLRLTEATIQIYGTLFWNVRARLEDRYYINSLVNPDGRLVELIPGYCRKERPRNLALRIATRSGLERAEEFLGLLKEDSIGSKLTEEAEALAARILGERHFLMEADLGHQPLPALQAALALLRSRGSASRPRPADQTKVVASTSLPQAIAITLEGMLGRRNSVQRVFLAEHTEFPKP